MGTRTSLAIDDGIAQITLDDGKVNALSIELIDEINEALDQAESAEAVTVLTGREGIFSAGFDLKTFQRGAEAASEMVGAGARLVVRLLSFPYPVLTACTGHAYPAGAFLMLAADRRLGISGPWQIGLNEVAIGLTVPGFAIEIARHRLTAQGLAQVNSGYMSSPEEALRHGFLDRVVAVDELGTTVQEEAQRLRALDMPSFAATKTRINERAIAALEAAIEADY